jgi:hypothetical protein
MPTPEARQKRHNLMVIALIVSLIGNTAVGALLIWTTVRTENYAACTARWQNEFTVGYNARSDAAAEVSQANDQIMRAVAQALSDTTVDDDSLRTAVENYLAVRARQDKERQLNPLPPLPRTVCGGTP